MWTDIEIGHLMKKEPKPLCEFCNTSLISIKHFIIEYSHLAEEGKIFPISISLEDIIFISVKNFRRRRLVFINKLFNIKVTPCACETHLTSNV